MAVASAGPYTNNLQTSNITQIFTGWVLFLTPNRVKALMALPRKMHNYEGL